MNLEQWLSAHGLEEHLEVFLENRIEVDVLEHLTENDLKEMGLPIGSVRRFLAAIQPQGNAGDTSQPSAEQPVSDPQPAQSLSQAPQTTPPVSPTETRPAMEQPATVPQPTQQLETQPANRPVHPTQSLATPATQPQAGSPQFVPTRSASLSRHEPEAKKSRKATAILIAVGVHIAIIVIAMTLTIFAASKDEPEIIATIAPPSAQPQQEMKKKIVQKLVKRAPSAASAAAAPMAMLMKANAQARFSTPEVTRTSTGPLGMGEGDLGKGAFGVGTGLEGASGMGGGTLFGTPSANGNGTFFDFKQTPDGVDNGFKDIHDPEFLKAFNEAVAGDFGEPFRKKYYTAPKKFNFTFLAIPNMPAVEAPILFEVQDRVEAQKWAIHYKFKVSQPNPSEQYRFYMFNDDIGIVRYKGEIITEGGVGGYSYKEPSEFMRIRPRDLMEVIIMEYPGGLMGGLVAVEKKSEPGVVYPFTLVKMNQKDLDRFQETFDSFSHYTQGWGKLNLEPGRIPVFQSAR